MSIIIKNAQQIELFRQSGKILQKAQQAVKSIAKEGVSLLELDRIAEQTILENGAIPAFKGYHGFPATLCTMLNSEIVHGIPDHRILKNGDIISIDCGVTHKGIISDAAFTIIIGGDEQNESRAKLSRVVKQALLAGCEKAIAGNRVGDIGQAIEKIIIKNGYSLCREYTGHGVGVELHEDPSIYNYGPAGQGVILKKGMTIAIEPIVVAGSPENKTLKDKWTVVTLDGKDACQWEHCGIVSDEPFEIVA
jgi:methionyl aminopeptidase